MKKPYYVSKNNGNLSRMPKIIWMFPNAVMLTPFHKPVDYLVFMLLQHLRVWHPAPPNFER